MAAGMRRAAPGTSRAWARLKQALATPKAHLLQGVFCREESGSAPIHGQSLRNGRKNILSPAPGVGAQGGNSPLQPFPRHPLAHSQSPKKRGKGKAVERARKRKTASGRREEGLDRVTLFPWFSGPSVEICSTRLLIPDLQSAPSQAQSGPLVWHQVVLTCLES